MTRRSDEERFRARPLPVSDPFAPTPLRERRWLWWLLAVVCSVGLVVICLGVALFAPTLFPPAETVVAPMAPAQQDLPPNPPPGPFDYVPSRDRVTPSIVSPPLTATDVYARTEGERIVYGCAKAVGIDARPGAHHIMSPEDLLALTTCVDLMRALR